MCSLRSVHRIWSARLVGATLFAVCAAAIAHGAGSVGSDVADRSVDARLGTPFAFTPTITPRRGAAAAMDRSRDFYGTTVVVSDGPWTPEAVFEMLSANGLNRELGNNVTVRVQAAYPPTRVTTSTSLAEGRPVRRVTIWLDTFTGTEFNRRPDATIAHQIGLLWIARYLENNPGFWTDYLRVRGLDQDERIGSAAGWAKEVILADDYRLLFGSEAAIDQEPAHMNRLIADPRSIAGLEDFLAGFLPGAY